MQFEELERRFSDIGPSPDGSHQVDWLDEGTLGVSRSTRGALQIFVRESEIRIVNRFSNFVRRGLWKSTMDGTEFWAWKIDAETTELPVLAVIALTLCLIRAESPIEFDKSLEVLLKAIQADKSSQIGSDVVEGEEDNRGIALGLLGELFVLRTMLSLISPSDGERLIDSWIGSERSSRDFELGSIGIEVKTTRKNISEHFLSGVRQIEPGHLRSGAFEKQAFLMSLGLSRTEDPNSNSFSIDSLIFDIEGILAKREESEDDTDLVINKFRSKLDAYFGEFGREIKLNTEGFHLMFIRMYDMENSNLRVLRSDSLLKFSMVLPETVRFAVRLPLELGGDRATPSGRLEVSRFLGEVLSSEFYRVS